MIPKIQYIILFLTSVFSYGQVTLMVAREDNTLRVNEKFTVNFVLEISGDEYVQETPLMLPDLSKFNVIGAGSSRDTYIDPKAGIAINRLVYQMVLEPKQAGKVRLGSILVQVSGKMYKTEPSDLIIKEAERKSSNSEDLASNDLYLNLEVKNRNVYANQPTVAVLRAYSRNFDNFRKLENVELPHQANVSFSTISTRRAEIEHGAGDMASQVIGVFTIFPNKAGHIELQPLHAVLKHKNVKLSSNKVSLQVKKLPAGSPAGFKNAVGHFTLEILNDNPSEPEVNKPLSITVKMKGEGNLAQVKMPRIQENEAYRIYEPKVTNHLVTGYKGMTGEVLAQYIIVPTKPGKLEVATEPFAYFNPADRQYVDVSTPTLDINVLSHQQVLDSKSTLEKVNEYTNNILETVKTPVISTNMLKNKEKDQLNWKIIVLNAMLFSAIALLFYFLQKRQKNKKLALRKIASVPPVMTIAEEEENLRRRKHFSTDDDLQYLKKLAQRGDSEKFFAAYADMVDACNDHVCSVKGQKIEPYFEQNFGKGTAESYRELSRKIAIEKYAPATSVQSLNELFLEIEKLFSLIKD